MSQDGGDEGDDCPWSPLAAVFIASRRLRRIAATFSASHAAFIAGISRAAEVEVTFKSKIHKANNLNFLFVESIRVGKNPQKRTPNVMVLKPDVIHNEPRRAGGTIVSSCSVFISVHQRPSLLKKINNDGR